MKNGLKEILLSRTTGLILIGSVAALCLIGVIVPQISNSTPSFITNWKENHLFLGAIISKLNFDKMYSSEIFLTVIFLLFITMSFSLWNLFTRIRKSSAKQNFNFSEKTFKNYFSFTSQNKNSVENILTGMARNGFTVKNLSQGKYLFRKYGFSQWGGFILHFGMLIIIAAALYTFLFEKRGFVQIIEGDTFFGQKEKFLSEEKGLLASQFIPDINISLIKFTSQYYSNGNVEFIESSLLINKHSESPKPVSISINHPINNVDGLNIYQSTFFGYTVCLLLNRNGHEIPTYFSLDHPIELENPFSGISEFPTTNYIFRMELFPDVSKDSRSLKQPSLHLIIEDKGVTQFKGTVKPGESILLGADKLTFVDIRHWSGLILTENQSVVFIFLGFGLIVLGFILIYIFPKREIYFGVIKNENTLQLSFGGRAVREPHQFEEEFRSFIESIYLKESFINVQSELVEI